MVRQLEEENEEPDINEPVRKVFHSFFGGRPKATPSMDGFLEYPSGIEDRARYVVERITDLNED
jgi:hypothetical protein